MADMTEAQITEYTVWCLEHDVTAQGVKVDPAGTGILDRLAREVIMGTLSPKNLEFFASLKTQFDKKAPLSGAQWYWAMKALHDTLTPKAEKPAQEALQVGNLQGLVDLFHKAKQTLKKPAIVVMADTPEYGTGHTEVKLYPAPTWGKNPGLIYLRANTAADDFFGKVTPEGQFVPTFTIKNTPLSTALANLLQGMSVNPEAVAAAHGKLTGKCCFCNSGLSDEKSTAVGYGPVCAKRWGLSWGGTPVGSATGKLKASLPEFQQIKKPPQTKSWYGDTGFIKLANGISAPVLNPPEGLEAALKAQYPHHPWHLGPVVVVKTAEAGAYEWVKYLDVANTTHAILKNNFDAGSKTLKIGKDEYRTLSWGTLEVPAGQQWVLLSLVGGKYAPAEPAAPPAPPHTRAARTYSLEDKNIQFGATLALLKQGGS